MRESLDSRKKFCHCLDDAFTLSQWSGCDASHQRFPYFDSHAEAGNASSSISLFKFGEFFKRIHVIVGSCAIKSFRAWSGVLQYIGVHNVRGFPNCFTKLLLQEPQFLVYSDQKYLNVRVCGTSPANCIVPVNPPLTWLINFKFPFGSETWEH